MINAKSEIKLVEFNNGGGIEIKATEAPKTAPERIIFEEAINWIIYGVTSLEIEPDAMGRLKFLFKEYLVSIIRTDGVLSLTMRGFDKDAPCRRGPLVDLTGYNLEDTQRRITGFIMC